MFLDNILSNNNRKRKWQSIIITSLISWAFIALCIFYFKNYGIALFIFIPLFIGFSTTLLWSWKEEINKLSLFEATTYTLLITMCLLLLFKQEGLICLIMALPLAFVIAAVGVYAAMFTLYLFKKRSSALYGFFLLLIPIISSFEEKDTTPPLIAVTTSIEINAPPEQVWPHVIEFPELDKPTELIFKTGIAYPINAKIEGHGVGAIRHCNFTTGSFVEPITAWQEPILLQFDVEEQPAPLREFSFWDIDAPHLHDYFISKKGEFRLVPLENGSTRLEGTTWYHHNIKPSFYWKWWSNLIVHKIHNRVLKHIKKNAEKIH